MQPGMIKDSISEQVDKLTLDSGSGKVSFPLIPGIISTVAEFMNDKDLQQLRLVGRSFAACASSRCKRLDLQLPFDPPLGRQIFVKQAATVHAIVKGDGQLDPACHGLQQLAQQLPMLSSLFLSIPSATVPVVKRSDPMTHDFKGLTVPTNSSSSFGNLSRLDIICTARDPWEPEFLHYDVRPTLPESVTLPALRYMCFAMRFIPSDYERRASVSPGPVSLASFSAFAPNLQQLRYSGTLRVSAGSLLPRCTHLGIGSLEVATVPGQEQGEVYVPAAASAPAAGDVLAAAFPVLEVVTAVSGLHPPNYDIDEEGYPMGMVFKQLKSLRAIRNIHPYRHLPAGVWNGDPDGLQQLTALSRLTLDLKNNPNTNSRAVAAAQRGLGQLTQLQHLRLAGITPAFLAGQPHLLQLPGLQTLAVPAGLLCWQCHMLEGSLTNLQGAVIALRQLTSLQKVVFIAQEGRPLCPGQLASATGRQHFPDGPNVAMDMLEESLDYFKAAVAVVQAGSGSALQVELLQLPASDCEVCCCHRDESSGVDDASIEHVWGVYGPKHEFG